MYGGGGAGLATYNITQDPNLAYLAGGTVAAGGAGAKAAGGQVQKANVDKVLNTIMQGRNLSPDAADKLYSALTAYYSGQALSQGMNNKGNNMRLEPLDKLQIESIVSTAIQDAVDFVDSEIAPQRIKAQRYFDLEVDIGHEEGRSSVISSKCRDVVRGLKPSLQRVFLSSEKPVEFSPRGPEDVQVAEQATNFISYKFQQQNGYKLLNDVFQDALVKKTGMLTFTMTTKKKQKSKHLKI